MSQKDILSQLRARLHALGAPVLEDEDRVNVQGYINDPTIARLLVEFQQAQNEELGAATIWRYMDLAKFISLLSKKAIWFKGGQTVRRPA